MITDDLFGYDASLPPVPELGADTLLMRQFIDDSLALQIIESVKHIHAHAPFRHMTTVTGGRLSASMTSCGQWGWLSDAHGYRYSEYDPLTNKPWPSMPALWRDLAAKAASQAGFEGFVPQTCLINCYKTGSKLSLHQDKDEHHLGAPVVGFSLGIPAIFCWGGLSRQDQTLQFPLFHGDALVFGGADRLRYHGILPIKRHHHALLKSCRLSLTFRQIF
ncbi:DNA oxidative demethylase AlkB [Neisseriaceae bacterium ESL0693]|nr:DNA oxidative demethylase AlkB [Neisseriaceae bacterium ESL0693]